MHPTIRIAAVFAALPAFADAQLAYIDQERAIIAAASLFEGPPPVSIVSSDTGPFDEALKFSAFNDDTGDSARAVVSQRSTLDPALIDMYGRVDGFGVGDAAGIATSSLVASFSIADASEYTFDAALAEVFLGQPDFSFLAMLQDELANEIFAIDSSSSNLPLGASDVTFDTISGSLAPGTYTLEIRVRAGGFNAASVEANYAATLQVPAPATTVAIACTVPLVARRRRSR